MLNCFFGPHFPPDLNWHDHDQILAVILKQLFYNMLLWSWSWHAGKSCHKLSGYNYSRWTVFSLELPWREARDVCLTHVWNLMAVIWFLFPISSLTFLPSPLTLFVLSFFSANGPFPWFFFFPENAWTFFRLFCMGAVAQLDLPHSTGICHYTFI